ncbi:ankyrin repeat and zinc finger domain-containing protein 1 [Siniperca chuatsi]|uniref:ankyrin repeat and zinc finger domain-containing protein 1 n=1 Tax=Siniperca chuatsi TaxID=119488 RepID=UPI001CE116E9|nr:ankyrin repeat and zinc finger domain-containing protein 1 [Siniperca chuatsi]XP_044073877.1 ankyrin repeat and zinc finger domain-containing protein 1 [Siniperca chuatsi]XP_044073878.1 ankyrin repeat and zinc finger domain-containing protein 1 [Siniperca chuatsi]
MTMTTCAGYRSVFDLCPNDEALIGLREVNQVLKQAGNTHPASDALEDKSPEDDRQRESSLVREVSEKMVCSACRCPFNNREEQMEHYKLDWHRFNLRQKMSGMPPVTAEEFERKTGAGDMSSISGSESDSEEEDSDSDGGGTSSNVTGTDNESSVETSLIIGRLSSKVVFQNSAGQYLSIYRCILQGKSDDEQDAGSSLKAISKKTVWVTLMTGGGHFAGAVFQGKEVLQHKTFHRYTVRAKRGTAQGLRDSQNRSHTPKSAGATLRRHNEAALVKDIQDLLVTWAEHLKEASAIFVRAPSYNKTIFFGGRAAPLDKKDPRIHTLPFATRRATFREVQRVHEVLSTVHVYGKDTDMSAVFSLSKKAWKKTVKTTAQINTDQEKEENHASSDEEEGGEIQLEMVEMTLGTLDLRESEIYPSRHRRRRRKKEETKMQNEELSNTVADNQEEEVPEATAAGDAPQETQSKNKRKRKAQNKKQLEEIVDDSWEYGQRDALFTACKVGDVDALCKLLQLPGETAESRERSESNPSDVLSPLTLLNKPIDSSGFTLLHVASAAAQKAVVRLLLDAGADPACRDNRRQTPYIVAPDKDTRNVFRKYMGENPDKYDYSKAQVPGPLTAEIESKQTEKKKAQKALRKQREKEQKDEKRKQELEAEEKKRFASLTDREKRALAAERRLAEQVAATGVSLSNVKRCWLCGESLLGKIPFQYLEYSFCTPRCVQAHRKANTLPGKT